MVRKEASSFLDHLAVLRRRLIRVLAAGLPYGLFELWRFIAPGLLPRERRYAYPLIPASLVLFLAGAAEGGERANAPESVAVRGGPDFGRRGRAQSIDYQNTPMYLPVTIVILTKINRNYFHDFLV